MKLMLMQPLLLFKKTSIRMRRMQILLLQQSKLTLIKTKQMQTQPLLQSRLMLIKMKLILMQLRQH